jgi:2-dehydro-3-deoxygalactonokinase
LKVAERFIVGDWGTSRARLYLCDARGLVLDSLEGPGVATANMPFAQLFGSMIQPWEGHHGALPAVLCGMIGSSIGWVQAPYVSCPANPEKIVDACVALRENTVHIVPGLRCENRLGAPDFMRGEETQILGALTLDPALRRDQRLLCLPGTHTKWVLLEDGIVRECLTAPTGELFAALRDHSILVPAENRATKVTADAAFAAGAARFEHLPQTQVLHRLFECRSRLLNGEMAAGGAAAFLSGLLIGADVSGALQVLAQSLAETSVWVIGEPQLTQLYAAALQQRSYGARQLDGAGASLAGLTRVHAELAERVGSHA